MKCIIFLAFLGLAAGQFARNLDDGQYHPDSSGAYVPDNSGAYVHDDNKYVHQDQKYRHQGDVFGNGGGSGGFGPGFRAALISNSGSRVGSNSRFGSGSLGAKTFGAATFSAPVGVRQGSYSNNNYAIIRKVEDVHPDGYHWLYETENGILAEEQGKLQNQGNQNEALNANGFFQYTGPDNVLYRVDYTADENGFLPQAAHLPTPPPIPEAIVRSLEYQRRAGTL